MLEETNLYPRRTQTSGFYIERWEMLQRDLTQSPAPSTGELQHVCHGIDRRKLKIGVTLLNCSRNALMCRHSGDSCKIEGATFISQSEQMLTQDLRVIQRFYASNGGTGLTLVVQHVAPLSASSRYNLVV